MAVCHTWQSAVSLCGTQVAAWAWHQAVSADPGATPPPWLEGVTWQIGG